MPSKARETQAFETTISYCHAALNWRRCIPPATAIPGVLGIRVDEFSPEVRFVPPYESALSSFSLSAAATPNYFFEP
jgi:hypothetical protein